VPFLVIQIPCFNEAETLPATLADLPRDIQGIDRIEVLVIDDGSSDGTADVARAHGVRHVVRHTANQGLGRAFRSGLDAAVKLGADIIVNTDADGQYRGEDIALLLAPILAARADIVIGDRQPSRNRSLSPARRGLQWFGSHMVRSLSGTDVPDSVSGFRAISRDAALRLNILSEFSYTVEMILQASRKQMRIASVPVQTNAATRPSRLFRSVPQFVGRQAVGMLRMYAMYSPLRVFFAIGALLSLIGTVPLLRFVLPYLAGQGSGHVQSLIIGGVFLTLGFLVFVTGLLADLVSQSRQLQELTLEKLRRLEARDQRDRDPARD
jgi:glycosyltransferase involved in cell wall biosynthesis